MSANVESMFYAGREKPWHGLGTQVEEAPTSADALRLAGLDWTVQRKPIQVCGGRKVDNFFANVRSSDGAVLGVVSDRYQVVQNAEAFAFTDALIGGEGQVHYETAGSLMGGRKIWLLAKLRYYLREVHAHQLFAKWYVCGERRVPEDGSEPRPNLIFQLGDQTEKVVYDDWNGVAAYKDQFNKNFREKVSK